jgi:hypothetical protein
MASAASLTYTALGSSNTELRLQRECGPGPEQYNGFGLLHTTSASREGAAPALVSRGSTARVRLWFFFFFCLFLSFFFFFFFAFLFSFSVVFLADRSQFYAFVGAKCSGRLATLEFLLFLNFVCSQFRLYN